MHTVLETEQFAVEKLKIRRDPKLVDELLRTSVYYALARDPLAGKPTENSRIWILAVYPFLGVEFTVYYSFTDTHVALLSITRGSETAENFYGA